MPVKYHNKIFLIFQLQHIACDDSCITVSELHTQHGKLHATGGSLATQHQRASAENAYQRRTEQSLSDENCFKVTLVGFA